MESAPGFDPTDHGLLPLRLETWCGLMFIALREGVPPLAEWLGDLPDRLAPYRIDEMVCTDRRYDEVATNWKLYIEVDMETYHTPIVHPRSIGDQPVDWLRGIGMWEAVRHDKDGTVSLAPGDDFEGFEPIRDADGSVPDATVFTTILPSLFLVTAIDSMWWIHKVPIAPDRTGIEVARAFLRHTVARADFETFAPRYYARWDKVIDEDNAITEIQFEGIRSPLSRPGPYAPGEGVLHAIDNWILDRILDAPTPDEAAAGPA
ncbi:MAG: SRPBCC family protein [Azospirillaceae bacterium]